MSAENLPLPMLQAIRRGQGKPVSADAQGLFALLEFFTFIYGAFAEALPKTRAGSRPLLKERCKKIASAAELVYELLKKAKDGKRPAVSLKELDALDEAYGIAVNAHEVLPEWAFIDAYQYQKRNTKKGKKDD